MIISTSHAQSLSSRHAIPLMKHEPAAKSAYIPHTHTHTPTQSRLSPGPSPETIPLVSLCVHRDAPTIPLGSLCIHRDTPSQKPTIKMPPAIFLPLPGFYILILYISQETARFSVCTRQVRGSILGIFFPCGLPVSCCLATSVVWSCRDPRGLL